MLFHNTFWVYFVKIAHNSCQEQCSSPFTCNPFWHLQYGLPNDDQAPKRAIERDRPKQVVWVAAFHQFFPLMVRSLFALLLALNQVPP